MVIGRLPRHNSGRGFWGPDDGGINLAIYYLYPASRDHRDIRLIILGHASLSYAFKTCQGTTKILLSGNQSVLLNAPEIRD